MIWLVIMLAVLGIVALGLTLVTPEDIRKPLRWMSGILFAICTPLFLLSCLTFVSAGSVGVVSVFGKVRSESLDAGPHIVNPFARITEMSVRTENYIMSGTAGEGQVQGGDAIIAISSNGLKMPMDVSVPYRLLGDEAAWVYEHLGPDYVEKLVRPAARSALRRASVKFTDHECWASKRDELAEKAHEYLEEEISKILREYGEDAPKDVISVSQILIGNVTIPDRVRQSIEQKLAADQEQQEMDFRIQKETKEAQRKEIEAQGIKKFQDIVSEGINENLLRWKAIDATLQLSESQNAKVVIIGSGKDGVPIILGNSGE